MLYITTNLSGPSVLKKPKRGGRRVRREIEKIPHYIAAVKRGKALDPTMYEVVAFENRYAHSKDLWRPSKNPIFVIFALVNFNIYMRKILRIGLFRQSPKVFTIIRTVSNFSISTIADEKQE